MKRIIFSLVASLVSTIVMAQNVGIGTTNPSYKGKLVVRGTGGAASAVSAMFGDTTSGVAIENNYPGIAFNSFFNGARQPIVDGFGGVTGMNPANGDYHIYTSAAAGTAGNFLPTSLRFLINKEGNIGLQGVSDPVTPLAFASTVGNKISLWGNNASSHYGLGIQGDLLQLYTASAGGDIAFGYGSSTDFTEKMRIKGNGNIGIGTNAPTYPVTLSKDGSGFVQKGNGVEVGTATTASAGIIRTFTNHALQFFTGNNVNPQLSISYSGRIGVGTGTASCKFDIKHNSFDMMQLHNTEPLAAGENIDMYFRTGNQYTAGLHSIGTSATTARFAISTGSLTERLSITHDGKVGINQNNPSARLEVNGKTLLNPDAGSNIALGITGTIAFYNAAFVVTANASNLSANFLYITIDNPICNGNPNAMLMVTSRKLEPIPFSVVYNGATDKWIIRTTTAHKVTGLSNTGYTTCQGNCASFINPLLGDYEFFSGDSFNVLVIF
jgi:hypothetical protein